MDGCMSDIIFHDDDDDDFLDAMLEWCSADWRKIKDKEKAKND